MKTNNYGLLFETVEDSQDLAAFAEELVINYPEIDARVHELMYEYHETMNLGVDPTKDTYNYLCRLVTETVRVDSNN